MPEYSPISMQKDGMCHFGLQMGKKKKKQNIKNKQKDKAIDLKS